MSAPKKPADRLAGARAAIARGLAVLPLWGVEASRCACGEASCDSPGKHPISKLVRHGVKDATKDPETIRRWWTAYPKANVAIATGEISGIVVLDVDPRHGGHKSLKKLEKKYGKLVETYRVRTGGTKKDGPGLHHYFTYSDELVKRLKKLTKKPNGLDVLADGGYVVGPGSDHISGARYEVESHSIAAFEREAFQPPKAEPTEEKPVPAAARSRAERVLAKRYRVLAASEEGARNINEYESGFEVGRHVGAGALEHEEALERLLAATRKMRNPRPPRESRETLERGLRDGRKHPAAGEAREAVYAVRDGRICYRKKIENDVEIWEPLCNFTAEIVEELVQDDGSGETTIVYVLEGGRASGRERLPRIRVAAARFGDMSWVEGQWGHAAVVAAGYAVRDRLRVGIHALSPDARRRHVHIHTGWTTIEGEPVYLTGGGAIGAAGPVAGVEVDLGPDLAGYRLPRKIEDPAAAMRASLELLDPRLGATGVATALWATQYRAPLATALPIDVGLHVFGPTGALKTTLAALYLCHHGGFDLAHLPANWSSTANYLERQAFLIKDAPLLIDDYSPTALQQREYEAKFDRVLRGQANQQGRGRLRPDASARPTYRARGGVISTGETFPPGHSLLARTQLLELRPGQVNLARLTELQEKRGRLPHAMAAYVGWLAPRLGTVGRELQTIFEERRRRATREGQHPRVPGGIAQLWLGLEFALRFAVEISAVTRVTADGHRERAWAALLELERAQAHAVEDERPTRRFLEMVFSLCAQGRTELLHPADGGHERKGAVTLIGWEDADAIYLLPAAAHEAVARACREGGEPFATRQKMLRRDLQQEGLLRQVGSNGRATILKRLGGRVQRVLALDRARVARLLERELPAKGAPRPGDEMPLFDPEEEAVR
jgi:hypothetical protein